MSVSLNQEEQGKPAMLHSLTQRLTLTLSGLKIVVEAPKEATEGVLQKYSPFMVLGDCQEEYDFFVKVHHDPTLERESIASLGLAPSSLVLEKMGILGREPTWLHINRTNGAAFRFKAPWFEGEFDGKKHVEVTSWHIDPALSVSAALKCVMTDLLLARDRIFLHSSGILHRNKAFLFSGKSGAGKTTVVLQSDERTILSDELIVLSLEKDGSFVAHGTPYSGSWGKMGANTQAPLHCIHSLAQTPYNRIDALSPKDAFRFMCQVVCFLSPNAAASHKLLRFAELLVPYCRLLNFQPTKELWSFLSEPDLFKKGLHHDFL